VNYEELNGVPIEDGFADFDKKNPHVYKLFCEQIFIKIAEQQGKDTKRIRLSSKTILGNLRWKPKVETETKDFKINDAFTSRYIRKFIDQYPEYKGLFELRRLRTKSQLKLI
jgi:hypothetical protein